MPGFEDALQPFGRLDEDAIASRMPEAVVIHLNKWRSKNMTATDDPGSPKR